ncbi:MAG: sensor histidine kinase, partial [Bdellovibrionales bacterium]|nr:sensor histidine kinase [Bdellovibrionales bacterium]
RPDSVQRMNLEIFERQKAGLPLLKAKDRQIIWTRLTENNGRPLFAMLLEMKSASGLSGVAVGILPAQIFSELGAFYRNQNAEFLLIDDKAYALAYTRPQYIGAEVLNFPIVSTVIQQSSVVGSGVFTHSSGNGEVYAYEKVAQSNLTLLLSRPVDSAPQVLLAYLLNLSGIAMILCLIAGFLIYIVSIRQSRGLDWLKAAVVKMAQGKTFLMPGERIPELREIRDALMVLNTGGNLPPASEPKAKESPSPVSPQQVSPSVARHDLVLEPQTIEKNKALREVGSGIVDSLRPALAAVLGHAQLARSKSNDDPQLKQHFAVIERESRRLRDVLENLEGLVREEEMELTRANLQEVLLMILASLRGQLASKGIILKKSLQDTATVNLPMKAFRFVIEELLANAGDAMGGVGQREIEISTHLEEKEILLLVRDSGKGIAPENLARVFDPFFTSHSHDEKAGLGLTKIKRIISAMNGSIEIQSHEGKGTSVSIRLPLVSRDTKSVPEEKLPKRELSPQRELEEESSCR